VLAGADRIDKELMIAQMQGESRPSPLLSLPFFVRRELTFSPVMFPFPRLQENSNTSS